MTYPSNKNPVFNLIMMSIKMRRDPALEIMWFAFDGSGLNAY